MDRFGPQLMSRHAWREVRREKIPIAMIERRRDHDLAPGRQAVTDPILEYDESVDAAYISFSDDQWHHQVRLDDGRGINYAADGTVIGVELLSPRRKGVLLEGLPRQADIARVVRAVGFRVLEAAR